MDIAFYDHGTIGVFVLQTDAAHEWWAENVDPDCLALGAAQCVEHRYCGSIIEGALADGLSVDF